MMKEREKAAGGDNSLVEKVNKLKLTQRKTKNNKLEV